MSERNTNGRFMKATYIVYEHHSLNPKNKNKEPKWFCRSGKSAAVEPSKVNL